MKRNILAQAFFGCAFAGLLVLSAGCRSGSHLGSADSVAQPAGGGEIPAVASTGGSAPASQVSKIVMRMNAGAYGDYTDAAGTVWKQDSGFVGGDVVERSGIEIANTQLPELYRTEHYAMDAFSCDVPNGKYLARLHFAETFEGISGPGDRVFSFNVLGREFKNYDVWVKAGGPNRAHVEAVPVEVTDGKFKITFAAGVENPMINAIELIPQ